MKYEKAEGIIIYVVSLNYGSGPTLREASCRPQQESLFTLHLVLGQQLLSFAQWCASGYASVYSTPNFY